LINAVIVTGCKVGYSGNAFDLLGKRKAKEKLATFLLSLSTRYKPRGLSATEFNLPMSRQDISNYLGMVEGCVDTPPVKAGGVFTISP
jgi:CRP/FNR family transcriptional regulator